MEFERIELIDGDLKVAWDYIGEGLHGIYDATDKKDIPLLRLNVSQKKDGEWQVMESVCTYFRAKALFNEKYKALINILLFISAGLEEGFSLKTLVGQVSYISEETIQDFATSAA